MERAITTESTGAAISWQAWLNKPNQAPVFFMLNSLATPNPIEPFYRHDWVEQAFPLYSGTPMRNMLKQSPWLVQPKANVGATEG